MIYAGGNVKLYEEPPINQVTTLSKVSQYESYLMLGFGASGKDLRTKWEIKYLGAETLDGVKTDKLELVAKDPAVRKNLPKVTVWMDTEHGGKPEAGLRRGPGPEPDRVYFNIKSISPCRETPSPSKPTSRPIH